MRFVVVPVAVGLLVLSGCGSTSKSTSTPPAPTPSTASGTPASPSTASGAAATLSVKETEPGPHQFAYEGLGPVTGGAVTINFTNAGKVPHELQLTRVGAGHSQAELIDTVKHLMGNKPAATPSWLKPAGGVGVTAPGATQTVTVLLPAGQYYAIDGGGAGGGHGPKPFEQGAVSAFSVHGGSATASLPAATAKIVAKDAPRGRDLFKVSGLHAGKNTITFDNISRDDHHVVAFPLLPGKTPADLKKGLASRGPPSGPPPFDPKGVVSAALLGAKTKQVTELNFAKPGEYVLVCFLTDRNGKGKPHFLKGMFKPVTVT